MINNPDNLYEFPKPIHKFLLYLIQKKGILLHGSNVQGIHELQPSHARCFSKEFGNRMGVYASSNCFIPIMFAISTGSVKMYYDIYNDGAKFNRKKYWFDLNVFKDDNFTFTNGMVYALRKENFEQGYDHNGKAINEWICENPVKPLGCFAITPKDFPFFE